MRHKNKILIFSVILLVAASIAIKLFLGSVYRLPVLMYHSIDYVTDKKDKITVSPEVFAKQMKFLHDHKYNIVTLSEAVSYIRDRKRPPARTLAITFDDGYENNYKYAYPALKKYNIPATIFVITDKVGSKDFLTWDQIKEMSASGIVDIESHTKSHIWLNHTDAKQLETELVSSREVLEKGLDKRVRYICYPMGGYNENVKCVARGAGYEAGFATKPKNMNDGSDVYEIKRVRISPTSNNLFVYMIKVSGYHTFFRVLQND